MGLTSMHKLPSEHDLAEAILAATKLAISKLFNLHAEHFYYLSLITTGEAHAPFISAWSLEALSKAVAKHDASSERLLKWSYSDSPYMCFGEEYFGEVNRLFSLRPEMSALMSDAKQEAEYELRLRAMEWAMKRLDEAHLFGSGAKRAKLIINVEVMPPDLTNAERARRLNPPEAIVQWLAEAAEE